MSYPDNTPNVLNYVHFVNLLMDRVLLSVVYNYRTIMEVIYTPLPTLYSPLNGASIVICPFSKFTTRQSEDLKPRRI